MLSGRQQSRQHTDCSNQIEPPAVLVLSVVGLLLSALNPIREYQTRHGPVTTQSGRPQRTRCSSLWTSAATVNAFLRFLAVLENFKIVSFCPFCIFLRLIETVLVIICCKVESFAMLEYINRPDCFHSAEAVPSAPGLLPPTRGYSNLLKNSIFLSAILL